MPFRFRQFRDQQIGSFNDSLASQSSSAESNPDRSDRPPLSKQVQTGWASSADTTLPRRREVGAEWKLGVAASGLDLKHNVVTLALSAAFSFDSHDRLEWFESSRISVHGTPE